MGATGLLEAFMGVPNTPKNREKFIATIPLGRLSERQDIANASLYLASDEVRSLLEWCSRSTAAASFNLGPLKIM
jgi:NAD(P)-dependent dehydrogenase (short-subunit alcohol dehydrogenase family)